MENKKPIIQQLQEEALNPEVSVSDLLRKAKVVAVKLNLKDFLNWIEQELNGYKVKNQKELPAYRIISGELKALNPYHGWQPILFEDPETANLLSKRGVNQPIGELDDIIKSRKDGSVAVSLPPEMKKTIIKAIGITADIRFAISETSVIGILDAVRNIILDWSLKLEKEGILGEELSFSQAERRKAHKPNVIYKIGRIKNFTGTIGNIFGKAKVDICQINPESKKELQGLIEQIKKHLPQIDLETKAQEDVKNNLVELDTEIKSQKPELSRIKKLLLSVKNIIEGATGNVIAQGIIVGIEKFIK